MLVCVGLCKSIVAAPFTTIPANNEFMLSLGGLGMSGVTSGRLTR